MAVRARSISHTNSREGLLRGKIDPTDKRKTTPVTTKRYSKTSDLQISVEIHLRSC